jgi:hypothetical protein
MAFQPEGFVQPPRRESLRSRIWAFIVPATGLSTLQESAWQRGKRETNELAKGREVLFMIVCAPAFAVGGLFVLTSVSWPLRVVLAALIGLAVAFAVLALMSAFYAFRAPYRQRDEAREYARALETHANDSAQWARRREITEDFRRETLEFARSVFEGNWQQSASALDTHWRTNAVATQAQLREYGADEEVTSEIDRQLSALDSAMEAKDDGYGDNDIRRLAANMQAACQNVWTLTRAHDMPPTAPSPPTGRP